MQLKSSVMQILRKLGNTARGTQKVLKSFMRIMIIKNHWQEYISDLIQGYSPVAI